jgi:hypothetical protein
MFKYETTQISEQVLRENFFDALQGSTKEAAEVTNSFIREIVRQSSNFREILEPIPITAADLTPQVDTDDPYMLCEKEPKSLATFVTFEGGPEAYWFTGPRYVVALQKIASQRATKARENLMTYRMDIRQVLADNFVKDMADVEDRRARAICAGIVNLNAANQITTSPSFTSTAFKQLQQALLNRRRDIGRLLMTQWLLSERMDLPASLAGNAIAEESMRKGINDVDTLYGIPVTSSVKTDVWDTHEAWLFSSQELLGKFFVLQDATLFAKTEANIIEFYTYETIGIGIGNRLSIQQLRIAA